MELYQFCRSESVRANLDSRFGGIRKRMAYKELKGKEEFRKQFSKDNPNNKVVSVVGKAAGEKWKSMSDADKAPYVAKAVKRKADYEKDMKAYNKKQAEGAAADEEGSDEKSMSEVNDDDEGDDDGSDEDDDKQELA
ncbi:hypothetical protein UlMin_038581 [Ulmus minor]